MKNSPAYPTVDPAELLPPWSIFPRVPAEQLHEARWQPMGFTLRLVSNSPAILAAAETSFGRYGPAAARPAPDLTFYLLVHDVEDGGPGRPIFRRAGPLIYSTAGPEATLVADLPGGFACGYFSAGTVARPAYFRWHFLELAFFQMIEARGLMAVHAAALVKNGRALLLRAQSGGGKTTLAYAGARRAFQALAEDVVWLDRRRGGWWGLPWSFHLLPDARQLFPELAGYEPVLQTSGETKLEVNLEEIRPGSTVPFARPGAVVLVERRPGSRSRLERLHPAEVRAAWPAGLTGLEMALPAHQAEFEALLQLPGYRLHFGDDIEASVDLLASLFE